MSEQPTLETEAKAPLPAVREQPTPQWLAALKEEVRLIQATDFVPAGLRGKPHAILACVLTGRELGMGAMESLREVYVVDGRPTLSAKSMLRLVRERGHSVTGEVRDGVATVTGRRRDTGDEMTVTFSLAEAERIMQKGKPLTDKDNWRNYPDDMLWARAVSRLCRRLFPDVLGPASYSREEIEDLGELEAHEREIVDAVATRPEPEWETTSDGG